MTRRKKKLKREKKKRKQGQKCQNRKQRLQMAIGNSGSVFRYADICYLCDTHTHTQTRVCVCAYVGIHIFCNRQASTKKMNK